MYSSSPFWRVLYLGCVLASLVSLLPFVICISDTNTILENLKDIPSLSKFENALNQPFNEALHAMLNSTSSSFTLFAPSNDAWLIKYKEINDLLQRSGYPEISGMQSGPKLLVESTGLDITPSEDSYHLPSNPEHSRLMQAMLTQISEFYTATSDRMPEGPAVDFLGIKKDDPESLKTKLPFGLNITDAMWRYATAMFSYHVVEGTRNIASIDLHHQMLLTVLKNDSEMVALDGQPQRLHVENLTAMMNDKNMVDSKPFEGFSFASQIKSAFREVVSSTLFAEKPDNIITPIKVLFGPASDPLSVEDIAELMTNSSGANEGMGRFIASVIQPDIKCSNGFIHIVDKVFNIPFNVTSVLDMGNYTFAMQAFNMCKNSFDVETLSSVTVFAPSNDAFNEYFGNLTDQGITAEKFNKTAFCQLLQGQVVKGVVTSPEFAVAENTSMSTYSEQGNSLYVFLANKSSLFEVNGTSVIAQNILLRNGAMHIVPKILEPEGYNRGSLQITPPIGTPPSEPTPQPEPEPTPTPAPTPQPTGNTEAQLSSKKLGFSPPVFPALPDNSINASLLGCPEGNLICTTYDVSMLKCLFQQNQTTEEGQSCSSDALFNPSTGDIQKISMKAQCFNASTHTCVNNYFLCPVEQPSLCGLQCYSETNYTCFTSYSLCPSNASSRCGSACYDSNQYTCIGGMLQPSNQESQFDVRPLESTHL
jgi:uncharacterized surface protein with fasciclin (FAS1) repeats